MKTAPSRCRFLFLGVAADESLGCGSVIDSLGASGSTVTLRDFRFYVHDVAFIDTAGNEVALELDEDGKWQNDGLALLDFEDGGPSCEFGNTDVHSTLTGKIENHNYMGISFTLGVPFARNHQEAATAEAPLNLSAMFWNWNGGYKFVRVDLADEENTPYNFHLGSTMCEAGVDGKVTQCQNHNRVRVTLEGRDPRETSVVFDLAELFYDVDLSSNELAPGCMSEPDDSDCEKYFQNIGLEWKDHAATEQRVFRFQSQ
ncbi:MAG: metallo-mystery pair system four-Cys motif protein [Myxococcales bacterium]|nr:MAG: metallo-mystery pair system four-Cys motif protein [Myxococcales bacterium]